MTKHFDYGRQAMRALLDLGGEATQEGVSARVGVPAGRLAPIMAGLVHNGYVLRRFAPEGVVVAMTEAGRQWTERNAPAASAAPAPEAPQPKAATPPSRPIVQMPPRRSAPPQQSQPQPQPASAPARPAAPRLLPVLPETSQAPEPPPERSAEPSSEPRRRGRPPKPRPEKEEKPKFETDESGFITHINGKRIF